jgi:hypothetical protein
LCRGSIWFLGKLTRLHFENAILGKLLPALASSRWYRSD